MSNLYDELLDVAIANGAGEGNLDRDEARQDLKKVLLKYDYTPPREKGQCFCSKTCAAPRIMGQQTLCLRDPNGRPGRELHDG